MFFFYKLVWSAVCCILFSTTWQSQAFDTSSTAGLAFNEYEFEVMNLLGLTQGTRIQRIRRRLALETSASKYLMDVYEELQDEDDDYVLGPQSKRPKRHLKSKSQHPEIENCNNIMTFSHHFSRGLRSNKLTKETVLKFNLNGVPNDVQLLSGVLRIYQKPPSDAKLSTEGIVITVLERYYSNDNLLTPKKRLVTSINSSLDYQGWHQLNITRPVSKWLEAKTFQRKELVVGVWLQSTSKRIGSRYAGLVTSDTLGSPAQQPFIIGCFHGPELLSKFQNLEMRHKRQTVKRRREYYMPPPSAIHGVYKQPKNCERLNFTLDFRELHMHDWVIAPKKFEAYFCGGECNFPLASRMNATNHAIVQTLMHLKEPSIPKPCCVPTALGSISILHYLNEDSVNLNRYPQSVAKQCGCH